MMFWIFAALFVAVITILVLWSVSRKGLSGQACQAFDTAQSDVSIYKSQLDEIASDLKQGFIDPESAKEAQLELARNILAAEKAQTKPVAQNRHSVLRVFLILGILAVPFVTLAVYSLTGSPEAESHPFVELMNKPVDELTPDEALVRTEALYSRDPINGKLADELSSGYLVAGRYQDAANTYLDALRLNGESAPRLVGYGMALTGYEGGTITQDAQAAFAKAAALSPQDFYPQMFLAEALRQAGKPKEAADQLQQFLDHAPKDVAWRGRAEQMIAKLKQEKIAPLNAQNNKPNTNEDETAMICSMVEGLAERLKQNPDDLEGWKLLVHSWLVLKKMDMAREALSQGRQKLSPQKAEELLQYATEQEPVLGQASDKKKP